MTDKQIIINNVDVSRCECHNPNVKMDCSLYPLQPDACKNNPNCYYKKWQRKEQECEKKSWEIGNLGYKIKNQRKEINIRLEQLDKLELELKDMTIRKIDYLKESLIYKQTLTEIKEIAEEYQKEYLVNNGVVLLCNQILNKISEVEECR